MPRPTLARPPSTDLPSIAPAKIVPSTTNEVDKAATVESSGAGETSIVEEPLRALMSTLSVDDNVVVPPGTSSKEMVTDAVVVGGSGDPDEDKEKKKKKRKTKSHREDGDDNGPRPVKRSKNDKEEESGPWLPRMGRSEDLLMTRKSRKNFSSGSAKNLPCRLMRWSGRPGAVGPTQQISRSRLSTLGRGELFRTTGKHL